MVEKWFDGNLIYIEPCVIPMPSSGQVGWVPGVVPVQSRAAAGEQCWEPRGVVLKLLHLQKFSEQCVPRSWLPSLYRTLTKLQRKKLAERAKKLKITIKRRKADGSMSVHIPQFVGHIDHHLSRVTRSIKRAHVSVSGVVAQTFVLRRFIHVDLARGCALFMSSLWTLGDGLCQTESPECWFISKLILSYLWPRFDQMYVLPKTSRLTGPTKTLRFFTSNRWFKFLLTHK